MTDPTSPPPDPPPATAPPPGGWVPPAGEPAWSAPPTGAPGPQGFGGGPAPFSTAGSIAGLPVSSAGRRFGAYLLDGLLAFVTLGIGWIIWSLVLWSKGQSPAKSLLHMRCVRTDTQRMATWGDMALREIVGKWLLSGITFGITTLVSCFMILGADRQGVWDKIANTVVVDDFDDRLLIPAPPGF